ncbi:MAG: aldehyde dehydrogenase family protein, partial [Actinomycetia bacterium]|nr:aldehyde dehydrogenase family protein [Actinomycetes bacterium]
NFMCAVIDEASFDNTMGYIDQARSGGGFQIVAGGGGDKTEGYYIEPTVVVSDDPRSALMSEEIFAPVLTIYVYDDDDLGKAVRLCESTSPYALTGAVFAQDRAAIDAMTARRTAGEPLQYVLGQWSFRHLELFVDHRVLIPRPETEIVAGLALDELRRLAPDNQPVLAADLGTGSGAIGLALLT